VEELNAAGGMLCLEKKIKGGRGFTRGRKACLLEQGGKSMRLE